MFMFVFRIIAEHFYRSDYDAIWIGVWHDKIYTYVANGTKETYNATFVPWRRPIPSFDGCGVLEEEFYAYPCEKRMYRTLCEKPVCGN